MNRYYIIVEGQVQGVGFRTYTQLQALKFDCTGWVKNLSNGMVEIQIQGTEENIRTVLQILKTGNTFIKVKNMSIKKIDLVLDEKKFTYHY